MIREDEDLIWKNFNWKIYLYNNISADPDQKINVWCDAVKFFPHIEFILKMNRLSFYDLWIVDALISIGAYDRVGHLFGYKYEVLDLC